MRGVFSDQGRLFSYISEQLDYNLLYRWFVGLSATWATPRWRTGMGWRWPACGNRRNPPPRAENAANFFTSSTSAAGNSLPLGAANRQAHNKIPHDAPPYPFTPSPTFAHSSVAYLREIK